MEPGQDPAGCLPAHVPIGQSGRDPSLWATSLVFGRNLLKSARVLTNLTLGPLNHGGGNVFLLNNKWMDEATFFLFPLNTSHCATFRTEGN